MTFDPRAPVPIRDTPVSVTRLGLGVSHLSGAREEVSDEQARATILRALDLGIRYFDVAPAYGLGEAERRLGRALAALGRTDAVVSTKVGQRVHSTQQIADFSRDGVLASLEESLERLGLDRVDIVLIHDPDDHWAEAVDQAYPTLARLRDEGVVGAIGVGMIHPAMLARFARETDIDLVLCAGRYGLMDHSAGQELLPTCMDRGIAVLIAGVLHNGLLADPRPGARYNYRTASVQDVRRAQSIREICTRHGTSPMAAATQFALAHPAVTGLVAGATNSEQLVEFAESISAHVPPETWLALQRAGHITSDLPTPQPL